MPATMAKRELEKSIHVDLANTLTYGDYLKLDQLLSAQTPLSSPAHHDELLFIVQHQTSELWMKLMIHELAAVLRDIQADQLEASFKKLARVGQIQRMLFEQWSVLETLTPSEYLAIDHIGLTGPGESWKAIENGEIEIGGRMPINPSGGLIGGGHPVGASGVRMLLDAAKQVSQTAGDYQVDGADRFGTLNFGGSTATTVSFVVSTTRGG